MAANFPAAMRNCFRNPLLLNDIIDNVPYVEPLPLILSICQNPTQRTDRKKRKLWERVQKIETSRSTKTSEIFDGGSDVVRGNEGDIWVGKK